MPRDGSGNYSLPAGNPVTTGTTIASSWANNTLNDIAQALSDSVSAGKVGANGLVTRVNASSWAARTIVGTANHINVNNGDGVAGNPSLDIPVRGAWHTAAWSILGTGVGANGAASLTLQDEGAASLGALVKLADASNTIYLISFNGDLAFAPNGSAKAVLTSTGLIPVGAVDLGSASAAWQALFAGSLELQGANPYIDFKDDGGEDLDIRIIRIDADTLDIQSVGNLGLRANNNHVFHAANVLGAIGMSGGLPTGPILESGSNVNGQYIRFANGLQICMFDAYIVTDIATPSGSVYESADANWTFPAAFSSIYGAWAQPASFGGTWGGVGSGALSGTGASFKMFRGSSFSGSFTITGFAIGRWF